MKKGTRRRVVDLLMVLTLPLLMAYSLIGETFHELAGTAMLILFLIHHVQNRQWRRNLRKGRYNAVRILQTILDSLLLVFMIVQPLCGILMSKHLYTFLPLPDVSAVVRAIHLPLGNWGFVLMCVHAGTHLGAMLQKGRGRTAALSLLSVVSLYGAFAFVSRRIPQYMFLRTGFVFFDYSEAVILFLLDYLAVMVLFIVIGYGLNCLLQPRPKKQKV